MRKYFVLLVLFLLGYSTLPSFAQRDDRKKSSEQEIVQSTVVDGIIYALPRNGVQVNVKVISETFIPGPYFQYAQKYLGINDAKGAKSVSYRIADINMLVFSEPDPNAFYKVQRESPVSLALLSNGIISAINGQGDQSEVKVNGSSFILYNPSSVSFTDLSSSSFYDLIVDNETGKEKMVQKNMDEKAREAADYIFKLRQKRSYQIISPSDVVPEDGVGYSAFIAEAKHLDEEYTSLFIGKTIYDEQQYQFMFVPDENNVKNEVLFRFSDDKGVLPKTDLSGKPVYLSALKDQQAYNNISKLKNSDKPNSTQYGLYYRIPAMADITISDGLNTLYAGKTIIAQFGSIAPIPANLLGSGYQILFNTNSGSLKSVYKIEK